MSQEIIAVLREIASQFGVAIDWTNENIQPVIQELIGKIAMYEILTSISWIALSVVVFIICGFMISATIKSNKTGGIFRSNDDCVFMCICCGVVVLAFVIVMMCQVHDIIKANIIPEYTFILKAKEILKN